MKQLRFETNQHAATFNLTLKQTKANTVYTVNTVSSEYTVTHQELLSKSLLVFAFHFLIVISLTQYI